MSPSQILQRLIDYVPEHYTGHKAYGHIQMHMRTKQWEWALLSLIELADKSGHYFAEEYWLQLADAARQLDKPEKEAYCKAQIVRNREEIRMATPFGWTTVKIDDTHFQHHISKRIREQWDAARHKRDEVDSLLEEDGIHQKADGRSGRLYYVNNGRLAETEYEFGEDGLILYFVYTTHWIRPKKEALTEEERTEARKAIMDWSHKNRTPVVFQD